jgi:hypothetical protein
MVAPEKVADVGVKLRHRLDDRLVVADDLVDDQADAFGCRWRSRRPSGADRAWFRCEHLAQAQERHQAVAQRDEAAAARAQILFERQLEAFLDRGQRDDVAALFRPAPAGRR